MPIMEGTSRLKTWTGSYSFARDGGATGSIVLKSDDGPLPVGSYVVGGYLDVDTVLSTLDASSAGPATAALQVNAANDIINAASVAGAPWSTQGHKDIIPDSTGSTAILLTGAREPTLVVAVEDIDAGIFTLTLFYK